MTPSTRTTALGKVKKIALGEHVGHLWWAASRAPQAAKIVSAPQARENFEELHLLQLAATVVAAAAVACAPMRQLLHDNGRGQQQHSDGQLAGGKRRRGRRVSGSCGGARRGGTIPSSKGSRTIISGAVSGDSVQQSDCARQVEERRSP